MVPIDFFLSENLFLKFRKTTWLSSVSWLLWIFAEVTTFIKHLKFFSHASLEQEISGPIPKQIGDYQIDRYSKTHSVIQNE